MKYGLLPMGWVVLILALTSSPGIAEGPGSVAEQLAGDVLVEINRVRSDANLDALKSDPVLEQLADEWSQQLINSGQFKHRPQLLEQAKQHGLMAISENVLQSSNVPEAVVVVNSWLDSPDHRHNLLSENIDLAGVAVSIADNRRTVVVFQGGKR